MLLTIEQLIATQEKIVTQTIIDWQAETNKPQTDDTPLIGIRIA
ncbi:MAG: hypothetical protein ACOVQA_01040 [Thermoflexibacteraceae bacterium]